MTEHAYRIRGRTITFTDHAILRFYNRVSPGDHSAAALSTALNGAVLSDECPAWAYRLGESRDGRRLACLYLLVDQGRAAFPVIATPGGLTATTCRRDPNAPPPWTPQEDEAFEALERIQAVADVGLVERMRADLAAGEAA